MLLSSSSSPSSSFRNADNMLDCSCALLPCATEARFVLRPHTPPHTSYLLLYPRMQRRASCLLLPHIPLPLPLPSFRPPSMRRHRKPDPQIPIATLIRKGGCFRIGWWRFAKRAQHTSNVVDIVRPTFWRFGNMNTRHRGMPPSLASKGLLWI